MKKLIAAMVLSGLLALAGATAVAAEECETGREYAHEHIVVEAHNGVLGTGHRPGTHQGFHNAPPVCF
jgi:hypothetical protein